MQRNQSYSRLNEPVSAHSVAAEYSADTTRRRISPGVGARALISAGVLVLTVWSVSLFSDGSAHSDTSISPVTSVAPSTAQPAAMGLALAHAEEEPLELPATNAPVSCSAMGMYHWQKDCPFSTGASLRHDSAKEKRKEQTLTRSQAEFQNYYPCLYCAEIKDWRAKHD